MTLLDGWLYFWHGFSQPGVAFLGFLLALIVFEFIAGFVTALVSDTIARLRRAWQGKQS